MANLDHVPVYCIVCGTVLPGDRKKRRSITCSPECAKARNAYLRARVDAKRCKYCGVPSSPEMREDFKAWRRERRAVKLAAEKAAREAAKAAAVTDAKK